MTQVPTVRSANERPTAVLFVRRHRQRRLFATATLGLSEIGFGTLFVVSAVGALVGSLTANRVSERLGRRTTS